ncbi:MAG TPA: SpoIVB peptidase S55 domain-containing protein [Terriglobales bacterium]|nr:SpoIVB peptidase S55 domain-containing protein [Terriglobales bacterium]
MKNPGCSRLLSLFFLWLISIAAVCAEPPAAASQPATPILPLSQVQTGMHGVAYTVFEGVTPEPMDVEVLGVMRNSNGPRGDIILVRLQGKKVEYTGVVAGMSGSPVYIDNKLVGAIAFRIGEFAKEPIAGVTPIEEMLEINALDQTPAPDAQSETAGTASTTRTNGPGVAKGLQGFANLLQPIETPLVFSGFTQDAISRFAPQFASAGIVPVMGAGSVSDEKQPEPLEAGSAVSAILVRGDLNIAATCTVTYMDPQRLLACGHPLLQFGVVDLPMTKARVLATLPSPMNAFKIINTTESVGAFVQDRHTGILGRFNKEPEMIPVTLSIHGTNKPKQFHYEVLNNSKLTPVAIMATVYSALQGVNDGGEDVTYRMNGNISVNGYSQVHLQNMFAPSDGNQPTALQAALSLGDRFGRIYQNPYDKAKVKGVELDFDIVHERRSAQLESARTDVTEARPGDEIVVESVLRPYRGERIVRQVPVKIPTSTPNGTLRILISDGNTLDRMRNMGGSFGRRMDLASTIALLNKEHANDRLYVSLLEANPQAMVEDKVMPTMPISVMNVMESMRGTQDMVVVGESSVNESSTPLDYVVSGAQIITVNVK